jgi:hypothetical protein
MKKIKVILTLMFIGVFFISCDSVTTQDLSPVVTNPTYTANVAPIMDAHCVSCHSGGSQFPDLDTYDAVKSAIDGTNTNALLCRLDGTCGAIMPPSGALPSTTVTIVKTWATNNYPN